MTYKVTGPEDEVLYEGGNAVSAAMAVGLAGIVAVKRDDHKHNVEVHDMIEKESFFVVVGSSIACKCYGMSADTFIGMMDMPSHSGVYDDSKGLH